MGARLAIRPGELFRHAEMPKGPRGVPTVLGRVHKTVLPTAQRVGLSASELRSAGILPAVLRASALRRVRDAHATAAGTGVPRTPDSGALGWETAALQSNEAVRCLLGRYDHPPGCPRAESATYALLTVANSGRTDETKDLPAKTVLQRS